MTLDEIVGGSPYGATTIAGGDGSRQPSEKELGLARFQGRHVAEIAAKLASNETQVTRRQRAVPSAPPLQGDGAMIEVKAFDRLGRFDNDWLSARYHFRSEEHTSELQSLMRTSYAVFCL